jgi:hypothetical protein
VWNEIDPGLRAALPSLQVEGQKLSLKTVLYQSRKASRDSFATVELILGTGWLKIYAL